MLSKTVLISGGASGIGAATARAMAERGAHVVVADLDHVRGKALEQEALDRGLTLHFLQADVSRGSDCQDVVHWIADRYQSLQVLFNNAGIIRRQSILDTTEAEWRHSIDVNLTSMFLLTKSALPLLRAAQGAVIVNTGSGWGLSGGANALAYCASKGGVVNFTRALALELAPMNIRVNCVCPGDTDTPMLRKEAQQLGLPTEALVEAGANRPLGRVGTPLDIANAVVFLASEEASFITGTTLTVDGGNLAGTA